MRIPYLQRVAAGLHIGENRLNWVELQSTAGRLRVRRLASEPVVAGQFTPALGRLARRLGAQSQTVWTSLDAGSVELGAEAAPAFDDAEDLETWLNGQVERARAETHEARGAIVGGMEEGAPQCLIVSANRQDAQERLAQVREAHLTPAGLLTGGLELSAFALLDPAVAESGEACIVFADEGSGWILALRSGTLARAMPHASISPELLVAEAELAARTGHGAAAMRQRVFVCGPATSELLREAGGRQMEVRTLQAAGVPPEKAMAGALALAGLWPGASYADFLEEPEARRARDAVSRREGQRAVLLVAATLLILLTGAHALSYFLRVSVDRAQTELAASAGVVAGLSRAEHDLERTASHVAVARELVKRRSGVAVVLDDVGRVVPSGVWLTELGVEAQERQTLSLTGLAFDEAEVSRLVRSLEGLPRIAALQMTYMQRLSEAESERASGATIWPLVRFELTASVSSFEPNQGARRNQLVEDAP